MFLSRQLKSTNNNRRQTFQLMAVLTGRDTCVRLRAKESDLAATEKKLLSAESQVNELQARLNDAVNQRRHWEDEYNVSSFL